MRQRKNTTRYYTESQANHKQLEETAIYNRVIDRIMNTGQAKVDRSKRKSQQIQKILSESHSTHPHSRRSQ